MAIEFDAEPADFRLQAVRRRRKALQFSISAQIVSFFVLIFYVTLLYHDHQSQNDSISLALIFCTVVATLHFIMTLGYLMIWLCFGTGKRVRCQTLVITLTVLQSVASLLLLLVFMLFIRRDIEINMGQGFTLRRLCLLITGSIACGMTQLFNAIAVLYILCSNC